MQALFEHRMRFAGFDTRALELEGDGPALLLLHGWADSAETWRPVLAALGRADRRAGGLAPSRLSASAGPPPRPPDLAPPPSRLSASAGPRRGRPISRPPAA